MIKLFNSKIWLKIIKKLKITLNIINIKPDFNIFNSFYSIKYEFINK
jgi:hypothetical protein